MRFLRLLIRVIALPILAIAILAYPEIRYRKTVITYTWYRNKNDYNQVVKKRAIDSEECKTYEQWRVDAHKSFDEFTKHGTFFIKVAVIPKNFFQWLKQNDLENTADNREKYAVAVYESALNNGIENKI